MADYGDKKYGLTGDDRRLAPRLRRPDAVSPARRIAAPAALRDRRRVLERGWFADDFSVTADGATVWSDDAETDNGWTAERRRRSRTPPAPGWHRDTGTRTQAHYYLAEWRNFDGFDEGLKYAYDTNYLHDGAWKVEQSHVQRARACSSGTATPRTAA